MGAEDRTSARRSGRKKREMMMGKAMNGTESLICLCPFGTVPNRQRLLGCHSEGRARGGDSRMDCHCLAGYVAQGAYSRWRAKKGRWRLCWEEMMQAPWMGLLYYLDRGREGLV